jgi:hypothetical protein
VDKQYNIWGTLQSQAMADKALGAKISWKTTHLLRLLAICSVALVILKQSVTIKV